MPLKPEQMELFQWRSSKAGQERLLNPASKAEVEEELATPIPVKLQQEPLAKKAASPFKRQKWRVYESKSPLLLAHPEGLEPPTY